MAVAIQTPIEAPGRHCLRPPSRLRDSCQSATAQKLLLEVARRANLALGHSSVQRLLHLGDAHFECLLETIAAARRQLCLEMYQLAHDPVGWQICSALGEAARRGVEVRVLLDSFGSLPARSLVRGLRRHGVEVRWYNPWRPWNRPFRRTHRKLLVADGRVASLGGINLTAAFSERLSGGQAWRDVALWLEGPAVALLARQFESAWQAHGGTSRPLPAPLSGAGQLCAIGGGRDGREGHAATWCALAEVARYELLVATPYFLPDPAMRAAFSCAARGAGGGGGPAPLGHARLQARRTPPLPAPAAGRGRHLGALRSHGPRQGGRG
jgi:cardiolipin synthase